MIPFEEARQRLLDAVPRPEVSERVPPLALAGRILARPLVSTVDLPPFDNSAMDGYALRSADLAGAAAGRPVCLKLAGRIPAGAVWESPSAPGTCLRIFTGSPMPAGADAVVMQEDVQVRPEAGMVWFSEPVKPWENIRFRGEDIRAGSTLLEAGVRLRPSHAGLAAATGHAALEVFRRPLVWVAATGSELLEPAEPTRPGAIHESNRAGIAALAEEAGAIVRVFPILKDDPETILQFFREASGEADFVITSGGVSVGELDYVKEAFEKAGGTIDLWRVLMKPGKPFAWGRAGRLLWFGLPGNPVSALVTFLALVRPALLAAQGAAERLLPERAGLLETPVANRGPRRNFMRVAIDAEGRIQPSAGQASHMLSAFTSANALLEVPPETCWPAGAQVRVGLLPGA